jgi:hypothetical protein
MLREEPILEVADNIFVAGVGDGGARLEETPCVGPQGLVHLLLHLGQVMVSDRIMDPWKLSIKARLRSSHELMEFGSRLSSHVRGAD